MYMCMHACMCYSTHVEVREQRWELNLSFCHILYLLVQTKGFPGYFLMPFLAFPSGPSPFFCDSH